MFRAVIPARYASTRLPGKPLRSIAGKPMIQHVYERARSSGAAEVWVATDEGRIEAACRAFGAPVALTSESHVSGTDRIAELATRSGWGPEDIVVNVQGDEPLLPAALIDQVADLLAGRPDAGIATLATQILSSDEFLDPNVVKVVIDAGGAALYFSRAPIPWSRDGGPGNRPGFEDALRHLGLYAYRVKVLQHLSKLPPSALEKVEKLEQLRALEQGVKIVVAVAAEVPPQGVDTEEDLARVERLMSGK
jgi:3-deoxy-manno-octulosonate cytidylyltransferase (CMP-KDO synthetase)